MVRQQRDSWVVRIDGIDTESGLKRPRQIGTNPSKRAANSAAASAQANDTYKYSGRSVHALAKHRSSQNEEQILVGEGWQNNDLLVATQLGHVVNPGNFKQTLERLVVKAGVRRLTSHGLRHTAATHMVRAATDVGELRAIADVLGQSPDMLMKTYAHALPESLRAVADKIGQRSSVPA